MLFYYIININFIQPFYIIILRVYNNILWCVQAHAAHPDLGVNAISHLIIVLDRLFKNYGIVIPLFDLFSQYIGLDFNGNKLNVNVPYESGELTLFDGVYCEFTGKKDALYVSKDSYLVKTLCKIYNDVTNSNAEPIAIGGATYARAFDNFVSFGANLPGQKDMCHQTDEFISIDNLLLAYEIYCRAIKELLIM